MRGGDAVVLELTAIGTFLGWQAVCGIALVALVCDVLGAIGQRTWPALGRWGWAMWLVGGTLLWLALGPKILYGVLALARQDLTLLLASGAVIAVGSLAAWRIRQPVRP